jgi:aerobic carbon-monoxide dehydrogenase medium subunit
VPAMVPQAEAVFDGGTPSAWLFAHAARVAAASVTPTSDGAGSADYRRVLVAGLLEEACHEVLRTAT